MDHLPIYDDAERLEAALEALRAGRPAPDLAAGLPADLAPALLAADRLGAAARTGHAQAGPGFVRALEDQLRADLRLGLGPARPISRGIPARAALLALVAAFGLGGAAAPPAAAPSSPAPAVRPAAPLSPVPLAAAVEGPLGPFARPRSAAGAAVELPPPAAADVAPEPAAPRASAPEPVVVSPPALPAESLPAVADAPVEEAGDEDDDTPPEPAAPPTDEGQAEPTAEPDAPPERTPDVEPEP